MKTLNQLNKKSVFQIAILGVLSIWLFSACAESTGKKDVSDTKKFNKVSNAAVASQLPVVQKNTPKILCSEVFSEIDIETKLKQIRSRYYSLDYNKLKQLSGKISEGEENYSFTYYYEDNEYESIQKIVCTEKREEKEIYNEFCFHEENIYFIFSKVSIKNSNEVDEYRYYIHNNSLINGQWKHEGVIVDEANNAQCEHVNDLFEVVLQLPESIEYLRIENVEMRYAALVESFQSPNFMFLSQGNTLVVAEYNGEDWLEGKPYDVSPGFSMCDVDYDKLPQEYLDLYGKEVSIYQKNGKAVKRRIGEFYIANEFVPYFGDVQNEYAASKEEDYDVVAIAEEYFNDSRGAKYLFAKVEEINGIGLFAKLLSQGDYGALNSFSLDFQEYAEDDFLESEEYNAIQADYTSYRLAADGYADTKSTWETDWIDYADYTIESGETERLEYVYINIMSSDDCSDLHYGAELAAIYIKMDGETHKLNVPFITEDDGLLGRVTDINNDGLPEFYVYVKDGVKLYYLNEFMEFEKVEYIIPFYDTDC